MTTVLLKDSDYRALFEGAPSLFLVLTREFRIAAASDAYLRATMTRREDILERSIFEVFPDNPSDPRASGVRNLRRSLEKVLRDGRPDEMAVQKYDVRRPASEGGGFEERFWRPLNQPVRDDRGEARFIIHRVEDVTDFVRLKRRGVEDLEREISDRTKELQATVAHLEAFSHTIAHDLRAPLRAMEGYARILLARLGTMAAPETIELLERIARSALWMDSLTQDILNYSVAAREGVSLGDVDLDKVVAEAIENYAGTLKHARIRVLGPLLRVRGHETLLTQCVGSLLLHAAGYAKGGREPELEIGTEARGSTVRLYVSPGAPGRERGIPGNAAIKLAIERMSGRIGEEPRPGGGGRVWLELKAASA